MLRKMLPWLPLLCLLITGCAQDRPHTIPDSLFVVAAPLPYAANPTQLVLVGELTDTYLKWEACYDNTQTIKTILKP